jgi:hypothetical protein
LERRHLDRAENPRRRRAGHAHGFFVAAEFALAKIPDTQLTPLIQHGHRRAKWPSHSAEAGLILERGAVGDHAASLSGWIGSRYSALC